MTAISEPVEFIEYPDELKARAPFGPYRAGVSRVVDGDTFYALIDCGFNTYVYHSIRLAGVDAYEIYTGDPVEQARGYAARDFLEQALAEHGRHVVLHSEKWERSFGRYVAYCELTGGWDLGELLVSAGHAVWSEW